jgi:hypothetical protein
MSSGSDEYVCEICVPTPSASPLNRKVHFRHFSFSGSLRSDPSLTRRHMHYYTTDHKYENVMARNIQRVNAVASATIGLGIAVRARDLARGNIGHDPPQRGWRMQDEITAPTDGPVDYTHLMSTEAFGAPN